MIEQLKTFFPILDDPQKEGGTDLLCASLSLYMASLDESEFEKLRAGINSSMDKIDILFSEEKLVPINAIDPTKVYVVEPGYVSDRTREDKIVSGKIDELLVDMKKDIKNINTQHENQNDNGGYYAPTSPTQSSQSGEDRTAQFFDEVTDEFEKEEETAISVFSGDSSDEVEFMRDMEADIIGDPVEGDTKEEENSSYSLEMDDDVLHGLEIDDGTPEEEEEEKDFDFSGNVKDDLLPNDMNISLEEDGFEYGEGEGDDSSSVADDGDIFGVDDEDIVEDDEDIGEIVKKAVYGASSRYKDKKFQSSAFDHGYEDPDDEDLNQFYEEKE